MLGPTILVVDDDAAGRESLCALVETMGYRSESYCSAEDVLSALDVNRTGCIISDFRMARLNGLDLQERLIAAHFLIPVILVTAYATTPMTVRALKAGVVTVLEKPCGADELFNAIEEALSRDRAIRARMEEHRARSEHFNALSEDERDVMNLMVEGLSNKAIAHRQGISIRTVESRRRNVFQKLNADSLAEVIRLVLQANG